ncbi:hypothetical protein TPHA_0B01030 [Tetrapisispora phaffii CBS 4417]|uniref:UDENN FLCN/SMCR8-type domain-containing protein n=1 Tax=Tetrapisispora phaffii (strain ATCC 24235 / CBS 4417 / NBRC 1672 / NRRL Y-8282 / UCD 70-5) TaxID=1071381 RepID=G8BQH8_TETPH|nr:hypothetical protein TPHA_0B01030 [Tetrapisispora phaffii CBS 4417]CCE61775.1 hypothetical protein TPHA_0B01030 [Tetrapisispora phaffii CBS 4417]
MNKNKGLNNEYFLQNEQLPNEDTEPKNVTGIELLPINKFLFSILLGHFCDKHGPTIVMVTQVGSISTGGDELLVPDFPTDSYCESCSMHISNNLVKDSSTKTDTKSMRSVIADSVYVSTQYSLIRYQLMTQVIRKAFSEETISYDSSPLIFFDDIRGLNFVMGFKLYDDQARGNERRYSLIFNINTKNSKAAMNILANNWDFIEGGFLKIIHYIQHKHEEDIKRQLEKENEDGGFTPMVGTFLRANKVKTSKNLSELTKDELIFIKLHKWNSYILKSLLV